jgi:hypothetical protein
MTAASGRLRGPAKLRLWPANGVPIVAIAMVFIFLGAFAQNSSAATTTHLPVLVQNYFLENDNVSCTRLSFPGLPSN